MMTSQNGFNIYLDSDGCFADFGKSVRQICGFDYHTNPKAAWEKIQNVDNFFSTLEVMDGAIEAYSYFRSNPSFLSIAVLTALPIPTNKLVTSVADKTAWFHTHIDPQLNVICVDSWVVKKQYASKNSILIDDSFRNIQDWEAAGGLGVHHKGNWIDTIKTVSWIL